MSGDGVVRVVDDERQRARRTPRRDRSSAPPQTEADAGRRVRGRLGSRCRRTSFGAAVLRPVRARRTTSLDATIERLWLLLAGGVLGGTVLALLAGLAVAGRAMRPIASLTAAAREIATTRDPSRRLPTTETEDEVAELARTLDEMLRELDAARSETQQMIQAQRDFVADASHELRTPLTSILANLELLEAQPRRARRRPRGGGDRRRARSGPRGACAAWSPTCCCSPAPTPGARGRGASATWPRSPPPRSPRSRPVAADHELVLDADGSVPVVAQPRRPPPPGRQPARERRPPHAAGHRGRRSASLAAASEAVLEVSDDGPGHPGGRRRADLRPLRPRRRARPTWPPTPAPASGSRSSRRSRTRTAARSRSAARPRAGRGSPSACRIG